MTQKIIILDFGSQTTQLIGRRVRELDTFCEILPYNKYPKDDPSVIGVILSGSPYSVHDPEAFKVDLNQFVGKVPVLGICYGAQFISHTLGGKVEKADSPGDAEEARRLFTAHRLTMYARMALPEGVTPTRETIATAGQSSRAVASKKVGEVSVTYAAGASSSSVDTDFADLAETSFGRQLLSLLRLYSMTRYVP